MSAATSPSGATVGVRQLKDQLSAYLDRAKAGEEITVTEHGRPIARLAPLGSDVERLAALVDAGIVRPAATRQRRLPAERVRLADGTSIADLVVDQRR